MFKSLSMKSYCSCRNFESKKTISLSTTVIFEKSMASAWNPFRFPRMCLMSYLYTLICWLQVTKSSCSSTLFLSSSFKAAQSRRTSVPKPYDRDPSSFSEPMIKSSGSMSSSGYVLLILSPDSSRISPCVLRLRNGGRFFKAMDVTSEQRNHRECWSHPSRNKFDGKI